MITAQIDVEALRAHFPMLEQTMHGKPLLYFDSAATTLKPRCVIDTLSNFYAKEYGTVHRAVYELAAHATERYAAVRSQVQTFLNARSSEEIIFTKGTTDAINLVASSFSRAFIKTGDEVLISEMEHHSNIVPWQLACQERGAQLKIIPMNDRGEILLDHYDKLLSSQTKIVAIAHIANSTGTLNPIAEMIQMAHDRGAKVLVDGAQSAAHLFVDVSALDADFFAFSGHKAFGPTGIGVLFGKKELLEKMPPYQGGGDMISQVSFEKTSYQGPPLKFEAGTPAIAQVIALGEALSFIERIGRVNLSLYEQKLLVYATEKLSSIEGLTILGRASNKGALITFTVKGIHPLDLGMLLDLEGIAIRTGHLCAQPALRHFGVEAAARISFAAYNTFEEVDRFVQALQNIVRSMRGL